MPLDVFFLLYTIKTSPLTMGDVSFLLQPLILQREKGQRKRKRKHVDRSREDQGGRETELSRGCACSCLKLAEDPECGVLVGWRPWLEADMELLP